MLNRKQRRALGFTEPRYRKRDVDFNGMNPSITYPFHSFSRGEAPDFMYVPHPQDKSRLNGAPRRWQIERERRKHANRY